MRENKGYHFPHLLRFHFPIPSSLFMSLVRLNWMVFCHGKRVRVTGSFLLRSCKRYQSQLKLQITRDGHGHENQGSKGMLSESYNPHTQKKECKQIAIVDKCDKLWMTMRMAVSQEGAFYRRPSFNCQIWPG